jgi:hypothetical protein
MSTFETDGRKKYLPFRLEPLLDKLLHSVHNPHQLILAIRRPPPPDPGIIDLALERGIRPLVLCRGKDGDDVFVRHEDERLEGGLCAGPGEEVGVGVYHFVLEGFVHAGVFLFQESRKVFVRLPARIFPDGSHVVVRNSLTHRRKRSFDRVVVYVPEFEPLLRVVH